MQPDQCVSTRIKLLSNSVRVDSIKGAQRGRPGAERPSTHASGSLFHVLGKLMGYPPCPPILRMLNHFFCSGLPRFSGWMRVLG